MKRSADSMVEPPGPTQGNWRPQPGRGRGGFSKPPIFKEGGPKEGEPAQQPYPESFYGSLPDDPFIFQEVIMPKKLASIVIGVKGCNVSKIRKASHCKVHVTAVSRNEQLQIVQLSGTANQIEVAVKTIRDVLAPDGLDQEIEIPPTVSTTISIYPEMVGSILGKNGATIKHLRERTGCHIVIKDPPPNEVMQVVYVAGNLEQVRMGYAEIKSLIDRFDPSRVRSAAGRQFLSARNFSEANQGGPPMGQGQGDTGRGSSYNMPPPPPGRGGDRHEPPPYQGRGGERGPNFYDEGAEPDNYRGSSNPDYDYDRPPYGGDKFGPRAPKMPRYSGPQGGDGNGGNNGGYYSQQPPSGAAHSMGPRGGSGAPSYGSDVGAAGPPHRGDGSGGPGGYSSGPSGYQSSYDAPYDNRYGNVNTGPRNEAYRPQVPPQTSQYSSAPTGGYGPKTDGPSGVAPYNRANDVPPQQGYRMPPTGQGMGPGGHPSYPPQQSQAPPPSQPQAAPQSQQPAYGGASMQYAPSDPRQQYYGGAPQQQQPAPVNQQVVAPSQAPNMGQPTPAANVSHGSYNTASAPPQGTSGGYSAPTDYSHYSSATASYPSNSPPAQVSSGYVPLSSSSSTTSYPQVPVTQPQVQYSAPPQTQSYAPAPYAQTASAVNQPVPSTSATYSGYTPVAMQQPQQQMAAAGAYSQPQPSSVQPQPSQATQPVQQYSSMMYSYPQTTAPMSQDPRLSRPAEASVVQMQQPMATQGANPATSYSSSMLHSAQSTAAAPSNVVPAPGAGTPATASTNMAPTSQPHTEYTLLGSTTADQLQAILAQRQQPAQQASQARTVQAPASAAPATSYPAYYTN